MGMGLATLGTAFGAATKGYMEGEKHRSDLEDAEARRGLVKLQSEKMSVELEDARREQRYRKEIEDAMKDDGPDVPGQPAAPTVANTAPRAAGIATPGEAAVAGVAPAEGAPAKGGTLDYNNLSKMQRIIQRKQDIDLKYGKIDEVKALQMMKNFKSLQDEGVIDGMEYFRRTGDREGAIQRINSTGAMKLDPGAQFKLEDRDIGNGIMVPNVVVSSPDGKHSFNQFDAMVGSLSPDKALSFRTELGVKLADLTLKKTAEQNLKEYRQKMADATVDHYRNQDRVAAARLQQIAEERGDAAAARAFKNRQEASETALDSILKGMGISKTMKETDLAMLPKDRQAEIRRNIDTALTAHAFWSMNTSAKGVESFSATEAPAALRQVMGTPLDKLQIDGGGVFTDYRGKKVYAPIDPNVVRQAQGENPEKPAPGSLAATGNAPGAPRRPEEPPVVTPAAGIRVDTSALPANPRERGIALQQQAQQQQAASNAQFASEVSGILPNLTPRQAVQLQSDSRFSSLPMDVRTQIFKVANQR